MNFFPYWETRVDHFVLHLFVLLLDAEKCTEWIDFHHWNLSPENHQLPTTGYSTVSTLFSIVYVSKWYPGVSVHP